MVHSSKECSRSKKSKHSKKEKSSSASSSSSSEESPPRRKEKISKHKRRKSDDKSSPKKPKRYSDEIDNRDNVRSRDRRRESRRSSSSENERHARQTKEKSRDAKLEEPMQYRLTKNTSPVRTSSHSHRTHDGRDREKRRDFKKDDRREKHDRHSETHVKIKNEEDFDRRQEELRRNRRRGNENRDERRKDEIKVKKEPQSGDERRQNNREKQGDRNRPRRRDEVGRERRENDARRAEAWQRREGQPGQNAEALKEDAEETKEKEKPNLGLSGALTEDTNTFRGVVIKYNEPPEARVPSKKWRLYPFKGDEALKVLHLHRQSAYLLGKLRRIADIPIDHPSCSKQHAVFQFRMVEEQRDDGRKKRIVKPYIIDLDSANGTFVNNNKIQPRRYVELKEKDVIKFAFSSREYVLLHDKTDTAEYASSNEESDED